MDGIVVHLQWLPHSLFSNKMCILGQFPCLSLFAGAACASNAFLSLRVGEGGQSGGLASGRLCDVFAGLPLLISARLLLASQPWFFRVLPLRLVQSGPVDSFVLSQRMQERVTWTELLICRFLLKGPSAEQSSCLVFFFLWFPCNIFGLFDTTECCFRLGIILILLQYTLWAIKHVPLRKPTKAKRFPGWENKLYLPQSTQECIR